MVVLTFMREKETKNTIRFREDNGNNPVVIGPLYVQKWWYAQEGEPELLTVTVGKVQD